MISNGLRQEIVKVRECIPDIGPPTKVIPLKLFLDVVASSSANITRALRWCFREGSVSMYVISFQSKGKPPTLWGSLLWYFDYKHGNLDSRHVLIHFKTLIPIGSLYRSLGLMNYRHYYSLNKRRMSSAQTIMRHAINSICSRCQSWGRGIRNFIAARGLGISVPRAIPGNLTHVFSKDRRGLCRRLTCPSGTRKTCRCF